MVLSAKEDLHQMIRLNLYTLPKPLDLTLEHLSSNLIIYNIILLEPLNDPLAKLKFFHFNKR